MTPPVLARLGKDYTRVIQGAYYTSDAQPCQVPFSQDVVPNDQRFPRSGHYILWCGRINPAGRASGRGLPQPRSGGAPGTFALLQQQAELALEVGDLLEVLVDAGEAHVGDVVQLAQQRQHLETDLLRGHDGALPAELLLHLGGQLLDLLLGHRPVLDGLRDAGGHLRAVEGLLAAVPLGDEEARFLGALVRGEPAVTVQALAPPADRAPALRSPRVDDAV